MCVLVALPSCTEALRVKEQGRNTGRLGDESAQRTGDTSSIERLRLQVMSLDLSLPRWLSGGEKGLLFWVFMSMVVICLLICTTGCWYLTRSRPGAYGIMGGAAKGQTSSSDITSPGSSSTNRELKGRMERFGQRLEEHKRQLEAQKLAAAQESEPSKAAS